MAMLKVIDPGLVTSLQDGGRRGFQRFGVPPSGALDRESLAEANALVGLGAEAPALEMRFLGPTLEAEAPLRLATAGAELAMALKRADGSEETVAGWRSVTLGAGDRLRIGPLKSSATAYLAVAGGFAARPVLGSAATLGRAGLGGFEGRAITGGDRLPLAAAAPEAPAGPDRALPPRENPGAGPRRIRVVLGPQDDHFTDAGHEAFLATVWTVSDKSDRMGLRLEGGTLEHRAEAARGADIVSDGIVTGAIQVPGSGQPILLLADRQTSGGYAKIAAAITADLPLLGRAGPGTKLRFEVVTAAEGAEAARAAKAALQKRLGRMTDVVDMELNLRALYNENLITGQVEDSPAGD
ncbi:MAG: biotin-dependent carboxyltransferase family protein [Pseudomonadota bacterium]